MPPLPSRGEGASPFCDEGHQKSAHTIKGEGIINIITTPMPVPNVKTTLDGRILLDPRVRDALTAAELEAILAHEQRHIDRGNNVTVALTFLVSALALVLNVKTRGVRGLFIPNAKIFMAANLVNTSLRWMNELDADRIPTDMRDDLISALDKMCEIQDEASDAAAINRTLLGWMSHPPLFLRRRLLGT